MESHSDTFTLLITINLQKCYLAPRVLNQLSISTDSVFRLLGSNLSCGPMGMFINWFCAIPEDKIDIVHIKTINEDLDLSENGLIFDLEDEIRRKENHCRTEIKGINPIFHSRLEEIIKEKLEKYGPKNIKIGIVGLNLESTLLFLVYELVTRFGITNVSTCRHLTHSSSQLCFDSGILQLSTIFKVKIFDSITEFQSFLYFDEKLTIYRKSLQQSQTPLITTIPEDIFDQVSNLKTEIKVEGDFDPLSTMENEVVRYLYRGSSTFTLKPLNQGFGGCAVFRVTSKDWYGQENASTVLKIGSTRSISREKNNFDRVSDVLGNNAPAIVDYVEVGKKAGIKFSLASMSPDEEVNSFRKIYTSPDSSQELIDRTIRMTFEVVLGRFYKAAKREPINLFEKYNFDGKGWNYKVGGTDTPHLIRERIERLIGVNPMKKILDFPGGLGSVRNVAEFMEKDLEEAKKNFMKIKPLSYVSFVHGDMNGNNILLDGNHNVFLIDFEYTCQDHILKDTLKLEVDVLFEYSTIETEEDMVEAMAILKELLLVKDLGLPLKENPPEVVRSPKFVRAWNTIRLLRDITISMASSDRSTLQLDVVMLRYSLFMMTLPHINKNNQIVALAAACGYAENIMLKMKKNKELYINWVGEEYLKLAKGRLGISILPGSRQASVREDISTMKREKVDVIFVLCTRLEMMWRSDRKVEMETVSKLSGIHVKYFPIPDQGTPSLQLGTIITKKLCRYLIQGKNVVCVSIAGLGRCGIIVASVLLKLGDCGVEEAIEIVKKTRNERAIENIVQENYVRRFYDEILQAHTSK